VGDSNWIEPSYNEQGMTPWGWRVNHPENFKIGKNVRIGSFTMIDATFGVDIEDDVIIGYGCVIMSLSRLDNKRGPVFLRRGCRIGSHAIIMPRVTVGQYVLVGANSLVRRDIPEGEIWFGTPARFAGSVTNIGREQLSASGDYPNII
jgi:acetyltransferase-like isoleucine patch superfamily enzyme